MATLETIRDVIQDLSVAFLEKHWTDAQIVNLHALYCRMFITVEDDRLKKATFFDGEKTWVEERTDEEGFQRENAEFVSALREGRAPALSAHDGLQATRIVLAADKAVRTGQVQEL